MIYKKARESWFTMSEFSRNIKISYENIDFEKTRGFIAGFSVIGDHNINQDSYRFRITNEDIRVAIADGLGSSKYSHIGSDIATKIATQSHVCSEMEGEFSNIYREWVKEIQSEYVIDFDTTLKFSCVRGGTVRFYNVGDGVCFISTDGKQYMFTTDDEFLNETDSLCSYTTNNSNYFTELYFRKNVLVIMYTDGIDQFMDAQKLGDFGQELKKMYSNKEDIKASLYDWIQTWKDKNYYDDKTMVVLYLERG